MKSRQFVGVRIDDFVTRHVVRALRRRGWREAIVPFTGYGTDEHVRVLGRLTLRPSKPKTYLGMYTETFRSGAAGATSSPRRCRRRPVTVKVGDDELELVTDAGGYIDVNVRTSASMHGLKYVTSAPTRPRRPGPRSGWSTAQEFGLISDIDDTILST